MVEVIKRKYPPQYITHIILRSAPFKPFKKDYLPANTRKSTLLHYYPLLYNISGPNENFYHIFAPVRHGAVAKRGSTVKWLLQRRSPCRIPPKQNHRSIGRLVNRGHKRQNHYYDRQSNKEKARRLKIMPLQLACGWMMQLVCNQLCNCLWVEDRAEGAKRQSFR